MPNKYSLPVIVMVCLLSVTGLGLLAYLAFWDVQATAANIISDATSQVLAKEQAQILAVFQEAYGGRRQELDVLKSHFVDPKDPVLAIEFFEQSAKDASISIDISLPPQGGQPASRSLGMRIFAQGSFGGLMRFLGTIENGPYLVSVTVFSIQKALEGVSASIAIDVATL